MFFLFKVALPCIICTYLFIFRKLQVIRMEFVHLDQDWKDVVISADLTSQGQLGQGRASSND